MGKDTDAGIVYATCQPIKSVADVEREEGDVSPSGNGDGEGEMGREREEGNEVGEWNKRDERMCPDNRSIVGSILSVGK